MRYISIVFSTALMTLAACTTVMNTGGGESMSRDGVAIVRVRNSLNIYHELEITAVDGRELPSNVLSNQLIMIKLLPGLHTIRLTEEQVGYGSASYPYAYSVIRQSNDFQVTIDAKPGKLYIIHTDHSVQEK